MDLVVSPIAVTLNTQSGGNLPAFTAGQVIDALVLRLIDSTHAQLAVGSSLFDVQTAVPLPEGAHVQFTVKSTPEGMKLVLMRPPEADDPSIASAQPGRADGLAAGRAGRDAMVRVDAAATSAPPSVGPTSLPVGAPAVALAQAVRSAAVMQNGLVPLFSDAAVAATLAGLPAPVRQALRQLLSFNVPADAPVRPDDLARVLARSGLFMEAGLASSAAGGARPPADLKAALMALRAVLSEVIGSGGNSSLSGGGAAILGQGAALRGEGTGAQALYRALAQALGGAGAPPRPPLSAAAGEGSTGAQPDASSEPVVQRPPPPYRGAAPVAQPAFPASIGEADPPREVARVLLAETDAALARQTLLQAASLPDPTASAGSSNTDTAASRWIFEVPFLTPQGTTVAQFEISRDGGGREGAEPNKKATWRARFAIDIEPMGMVHAQVAVMGERTAVTLWAERELGATQLREHAGELAASLRAVTLDPSEVVVRGGAPPRPAKTATPAGRFLDRAS